MRRISVCLAIVLLGIMPSIAFNIFQLPTASAAAKSPVDVFIDLVRKDDAKKVQEMLEEDPTLATSEVRKDGSTPLHYVRSVKVAQLLLDQGANLFALDHQYNATPLRWAAERFGHAHVANVELIHYLQSKGASEPDFFFAVAVGDMDRVKLLLAKDEKLAVTAGDPQDILADGAQPLHLAAFTGQFEIAKLLVEKGASVNDRGSWANTEPLEKACWADRPEIVTFLLDHGAKIDGTDSDFTHSPLFNAAQDGHPDVVKILIDRGAKVQPTLLAAVKAAAKDLSVRSDPEMSANYDRIVKMLTP
jgi:hypothetical protein